MTNTAQEKKLAEHDDIFHERIVDTFFGKPRNVPASPHSPVPEPRKQKIAEVPVSTPRPRRSRRALFLGAGFALVIIALAIASVVFLPPANTKTSGINLSNYNVLLAKGNFSRRYVKSFAFEGDARGESLMRSNGIHMVNSVKNGWARAAITFAEPLDMSRSTMMIQAKSSPGSAALLLILRDVDGRSHTVTVQLSPAWQWKHISASRSGDLNRSEISGFEFEIGQATAGNSPNTEISISEIGVRSINS